MVIVPLESRGKISTFDYFKSEFLSFSAQNVESACVVLDECFESPGSV